MDDSHKTAEENVEFPDALILIFAKTPVIGRVKTRLIPSIGGVNAHLLCYAMMEQTVNTVTSSHLCNATLVCYPITDHHFLQTLQTDYAIELDTQHGNNLGERMYHAAEKALKSYKRVILIGCDCLQLAASHLQEALSTLSAGDTDAVIIPALDGGYVLLGLNQANQALFENIDWGTEKVLEQTRDALEKLQWNWHEMQALRDLDTYEDLMDLNNNKHQYQFNTGVRELLEPVFKELT